MIMKLRTTIILATLALGATASALRLSGPAAAASPANQARHSDYSFGASRPDNFSFGVPRTGPHS